MARPATPAADETVIRRRTTALSPRAVPTTPSKSDAAHRVSTLAAEVTVLRTVADALVDGRGLDSALLDVLNRCLGPAGFERGAICVRGTSTSAAEWGFAVRAQQGFSGTREVLSTIRADRDALDRVMSEAVIASTPAGAVLVPLVSRSEVLGVLLLQASNGTPEQDWAPLIQAVGRQVSVSLALARTFDRVEASERRARTLMEHAEDAIFVVSTAGTILEANRSAERLLGLTQPEIVGRQYSDFATDAPSSSPIGLPAKDGTSAGTMDVRRADGSIATVECTVGLVDVGEECVYVTIVRDVTERNALAERLKGAQKLEAIGRLSGGVAHDFNNLLSVVISYADLLLGDLPAESQLREDVLEIRKAGHRAADLARQLLVFGREQPTEHKTISLNEIVVGMENMARRLIGADIELTTALAPDLGSVFADPTHLHQVLMNLVVNARDAMPEGGRLRISTGNVDVAAGREDPEVGLPAGHYVRLTVVDTGIGMDAATIERIFQPFFTTKAPDRGTGLGLSTVLGIVQQLGGKVRVTSQLGRGARFHVYLPRTDVPSVRRRQSSTMPSVGPRGSETVLVVEDEDQVRSMLVEVLHRAGYTVIDAANAGEALLLAEEEEGPIDLLVTDLVLPRLSGHRLAERLCKLRPEMKVLLMSGYTNGRRPWREEGAGSHAVLQKPVTPAALVQRVRDVLDPQLSFQQGGGLS